MIWVCFAMAIPLQGITLQEIQEVATGKPEGKIFHQVFARQGPQKWRMGCLHNIVIFSFLVVVRTSNSLGLKQQWVALAWADSGVWEWMLHEVDASDPTGQWKGLLPTTRPALLPVTKAKMARKSELWSSKKGVPEMTSHETLMLEGKALLRFHNVW